MAHPKLARHGEQWRHKKRIPEVLRPHYDGASFRTFSTKTADPEDARAECLRWLANLTEEFRRLSKMIEGGSPVSAVAAYQDLTPQQVGGALAVEADRYKAELLAADESLGFMGHRPQADAKSVERRAAFVGIAEDMARAAFFDCEEDALRHFTALGCRRMKAVGVPVEADDEALAGVARSVGAAFSRAALEVVAVIRQRVAYELDTTPNPLPRVFPAGPTESTPLAAPTPAKLHRLSETLEGWQVFRKPTAGTVVIYKAAVKFFEERFPDLYAETITKADVKAFIVKRMDEGKSAATIKKEFSIISSMLARAVEEGWRTDNPASGVELPKASGARKRRGYKPEELAAVFRAGVFTKGDRPAGGKGEAAFWLPLLAAFTGARREELAQLETDRIRTESGVPYLAIDPLDDSGQLKTDESRRAVPVHRELIRLGFLTFVEDRRKAGGGHLFPRLKPNKLKQYAASWGTWWSDYMRTASGIDDKTIGPMHSFRHSVITDLRQQRIREDEERQLLGHTDRDGRGVQQDSHDKYGEHLVPTLAAVLNLVTHRGLDLSGVKPYVSRYKPPG